MRVKVINIPIRYEGVTYKIGDIFNIDEKYFKSIEKYVEVIEKQEEKTNENTITEEFLEELSYNDLKSFLKEQGLNIGSLRKHKEILEFAKEELL